MEIEKSFIITGKKKINFGVGITTPTQEVYNLLRENGFYDLEVKLR